MTRPLSEQGGATLPRRSDDNPHLAPDEPAGEAVDLFDGTWRLALIWLRHALVMIKQLIHCPHRPSVAWGTDRMLKLPIPFAGTNLDGSTGAHGLISVVPVVVPLHFHFAVLFEGIR